MSASEAAAAYIFKLINASGCEDMYHSVGVRRVLEAQREHVTYAYCYAHPSCPTVLVNISSIDLTRAGRPGLYRSIALTAHCMYRS